MSTPESRRGTGLAKAETAMPQATPSLAVIPAKTRIQPGMRAKHTKTKGMGVLRTSFSLDPGVRRDDGGQVSRFSKSRTRSRLLLRLCLTALASALCATAMAQQAPLTGRMLGNQPQTTQTTPDATTPPAPPPRTQPATTYPAQPADSGQQASPPPTHAPMPAYTDMQTLNAQADAADPDMPPPRDPVFGIPVGDATEHLLHMQAHNRAAGPALPMLGDEAGAAYKRYIDSFKHPIPEFFQTKVESSSGSSSGSGM